MIQIDTGTAVGAGIAFLGMLFGFGKMLVSQIEKRMDEKFDAQNQLREQQMTDVKSSITYESGRVSTLSDLLNRLAAELPLQYVRREDWIRFSATIDQKLDRLADMFMRSPLGKNNESN